MLLAFLLLVGGLVSRRILLVLINIILLRFCTIGSNVTQEPKQDDIKYSEWVDKLSKVHNFAEIVVAKHRNGAIGNVSVYYEDRYSTVSNLEKNH